MQTALQTVDPDMLDIHRDDIKCLAVRYHAFCAFAVQPDKRDRAEFWAWMLDEVQKKTGVVMVEADLLDNFLRNRSN